MTTANTIISILYYNMKFVCVLCYVCHILFILVFFNSFLIVARCSVYSNIPIIIIQQHNTN